MTEDYLLLENDHDHSYVFHTVYDRIYSRDQGLNIGVTPTAKDRCSKIYSESRERIAVGHCELDLSHDSFAWLP